MTIEAKIIADSIGEHAPRLTTLQLRYPKFIHGEFMTHRLFSRNASSSRAIPVERLIQDVIDDPVYPSYWGKNQKGMQAAKECDTLLQHPRYADRPRDMAWDLARHEAIDWAHTFAAAGYHKQIVNRLLEPFCHINVVVTATEWDNFFALRCRADAQPEMRELAEKMRDAMVRSAPRRLGASEWHLPYATDGDTVRDILAMDKSAPENMMAQVALSVARCARVSYLTQEGKRPSIEEDLKLYVRLMGSTPIHASPSEHQAMPDSLIYVGGPHWHRPHLHGNLVGWCQYRKMLEHEVVSFRPSSDASPSSLASVPWVANAEAL